MMILRSHAHHAGLHPTFANSTFLVATSPLLLHSATFRTLKFHTWSHDVSPLRSLPRKGSRLKFKLCLMMFLQILHLGGVV